MDNRVKQRISGKTIALIIVFALMLAIIVALLTVISETSDKSVPEATPVIISEARIQNIINMSDLSTFEAVYNGIAKVPNADKPEKIDYYVAYEAKVKAGIDFEEVKLSVDSDEKLITVKLPKIKITETVVDIESMDYIFVNEKANTPTVSAQAYKQCISDVKDESSTEKAIYELAEQNARSIIEALISPFVLQLDDEYQLRID